MTAIAKVKRIAWPANSLWRGVYVNKTDFAARIGGVLAEINEIRSGDG